MQARIYMYTCANINNIYMDKYVHVYINVNKQVYLLNTNICYILSIRVYAYHSIQRCTFTCIISLCVCVCARVCVYAWRQHAATNCVCSRGRVEIYRLMYEQKHHRHCPSQ